MNLHMRPPLADEWPICRMLLPETFAADASQREYLLCLRDESPRIVGAASYRRASAGAVTHLRVHVIRTFRRRGVASQMIAAIAQHGVGSLSGACDIVRAPGAAPFCERNLFYRAAGLTTVEGDIAAIRRFMSQLRARAPQSLAIRIVPLAEASLEQVAELHAQYVAHQTELSPWRARLAAMPELGQSPTALIDGRLAGILLWEMQDGMAVVRSRVAAPGPHSKWVNVILLAEGLDGAWLRGARRVRFQYADNNHDTRKLAVRFQAAVTSELVEYRRDTGTLYMR
jgi:hypothetical protein